MSKYTYEEIINRLSSLRIKAGYSMREISLMLGYNPQFMKTIENQSVELKVRTLIDFCDVIGITIEEFFRQDNINNSHDKELFEMIEDLTNEDKELIYTLTKKVKNK